MEGRARTVVSDQLSQFTGQSKNSRLWVQSHHRPGQTSAAAPSTRYFLYLAFHKSGQLTNLTSWSLLRFCFILSLQPVSPTSHTTQHFLTWVLGTRTLPAVPCPALFGSSGKDANIGCFVFIFSMLIFFLLLAQSQCREQTCQEHAR